MSDKKTCIICLAFIVLLLLLILIPLTFSYVEYYEYGLDQRKSTGSVDTTAVYAMGRHAIGPDHRFIIYQADAHYEKFDELSVFSASGSNESIGLEVLIDVDLTYFLIQDEIGDLHKDLSTNYPNVIASRAKDAIKNEAIYVTLIEYFAERKSIEQRYREAIERRWREAPSLHCTLDQFRLSRIQIPDSVAHKQLEAQIQNERNYKEEYLQTAQLERELTAVEVNTINLEREKVLRTARAESSLILSKAKSSADHIKAQALTNGTNLLLAAAGIVSQEHKSAFTYIQTLRNRDSLDLAVSYLSADNILRTTAV